jgi:hypothetical protein
MYHSKTDTFSVKSKTQVTKKSLEEDILEMREKEENFFLRAKLFDRKLYLMDSENEAVKKRNEEESLKEN